MDPLQTFLQQIANQPQPGGGLPAVPPQIIPPQNPTIPNNKALAPFSGWGNAMDPGQTIDASEFAGGGMPWWMKYLKVPSPIGAVSAVMQPTSTAANDTISPLMAGARPQHPASTGVMPGQWHAGGTPTGPTIAPPAGDDGGQNNPLQAAAGIDATIPPFTIAPGLPARPTSTGRMPPVAQAAAPALQPAPVRPATPTSAALGPAAPSKKKQIDPKKVDLGNTRFTTFQYHVPNSARHSPIYTALNFGGSS